MKKPLKSYEEFFYNLTETEKPIVASLRQIVLNSGVNFQEKVLRYGVPYYYRHAWVCFIWPASVKMGPKTGVEFGFPKGYLLSNEQGVLDFAGRKEVAVIQYNSVADIDAKVLQEIIQEAVLVDEFLETNNPAKP